MLAIGAARASLCDERGLGGGPATSASNRVEGVSQEPTASTRSSSMPSALGAPLEAAGVAACRHNLRTFRLETKLKHE